MFEKLLPSNYMEFLASIFLIASSISLMCAIRKKGREYSIRIFSIFLILFITMLSNNWSIYLVALFIIASLITDNNFLLNLLAIIRNNEAFFKYKKSRMSYEETEEKLEYQYGDQQIEMMIMDKKVVEKRDGKLKINFLYLAEQIALNRVEEKIGARIQRNIKIEKFPHVLELDGLIEEYDFDVNGEPRDAVFEVKIFSYPSKTAFDLFFNKVYSQLSIYDKITKRNSVKFIVVVINNKMFLETINREGYKSKYELINKNCIVEFIDYDSIGVDKLKMLG